jgi:hypothetical protein
VHAIVSDVERAALRDANRRSRHVTTHSSLDVGVKSVADIDSMFHSQRVGRCVIDPHQTTLNKFFFKSASTTSHVGEKKVTAS